MIDADRMVRSLPVGGFASAADDVEAMVTLPVNTVSDPFAV
jgi:hypothetical protein